MVWSTKSFRDSKHGGYLVAGLGEVDYQPLGGLCGLQFAVAQQVDAFNRFLGYPSWGRCSWSSTPDTVNPTGRSCRGDCPAQRSTAHHMASVNIVVVSFVFIYDWIVMLQK